MIEVRLLTVRQPWAWAIIHGGKDVENRTWRTNYRGPLVIHAGAARPDRDDMDAFHEISGTLPHLVAIDLGVIVGVVDLVGCRDHSASRWHAPDQWAWELKNPRPLPKSKWKGSLWLRRIDQPERVPGLVQALTA